MNFTLLVTCVLLSIVLIVLFTSVLKYNTFLSMLITSVLLGVIVLPSKNVVAIIAQGFGDTMKSIGIIIILGIMIGLILERTGATISMAKAILKLTGKNKAGLAIGITGIVTGIPIFCNSGFIVLSGLNKSLVKTTGKPMIYMATMLAAGLYSIHCLIPPHPGALAAAGILKPDIGNLILVGICIAIPSALAGFVWAHFACRKQFENSLVENSEQNSHFEDQKELPSVFHSFLPIIVPLILLTSKSIILLGQQTRDTIFIKSLNFLGSPEIALLIGVFLALSLFKKHDKKTTNGLFDEAIEKAGPILALTAAGGVFGAIIKATGIGEQAGTYMAATGMGLFIPFIIAVFLKTAQGSSTVAIMTAASIVAPMLPALHLDSASGRLLSTLAMGTGSMAISHANDSYFWVVAKFSDLETNETLKVYSSATFIMGIAGFLSVLIASIFIL
jgi:gluconate:H+ symporter, GntP family